MATRVLSRSAQAAVESADAELSAEQRIGIIKQLDRDALALNEAFARLCGSELGVWLPFDIQAAFNTARHVLEDLTVSDKWAFADFVMRLHTIMVQQGPARRRPQGTPKRGWPGELDVWYRQLDDLTARINVVRIFCAHDKNLSRDGLRDVDRFNEALEHFVQCRMIAPADRNGWARLAAAMLRETGEVVHRCAEEATARAQQQRRNDIPEMAVTVTKDGPQAATKVLDFVQARGGTWEGRVRD